MVSVFLWSTYLSMLTDKGQQKGIVAINFYIKSILTFDTWNENDKYAGDKLSIPWPWMGSKLRSVEFKKTEGVFQPLDNENAYKNLYPSTKYWDKLTRASSVGEQEAIYQKAVNELKEYSAIAKYRGADIFAFGLLASVFSIVLFITLFFISQKASSRVTEDINQFKYLIQMLIKKISFIVFNEQFFKRNVIVILIFILLILVLSMFIAH